MDLAPAPRRRRWVWPVVGVVVLAATAAGLLIARNGQANGDKKKDKKDTVAAAPVELSTVGKGSISTFLETTTVLEPENTATLVARRQGQVVALLAEEGRSVAKGQVLARLEDTEARIALERSKVALEQAQSEATRGQALQERGVQAQATLDGLIFKLRTAKENVAQAEYDLRQTRIVAPFAGKVTARMIQLGETVTPGKECFRVDDFSPLLARVYFPEREQNRVHVGQGAVLELDAQPGRSFSAKVTIVNPTVDRSNGTFKVTLEVTDPDAVLRPGSFARVRLESASYADVVVLPRKAVVTEDGDSYVFVAQGDSVNRVAVQIGAIAGDTAQILAGLLPGTKVVTVGQGGLKQGARIKPVAF